MLPATSPGSGRRRGASGEAFQSAKRTCDPEDSGSDSDGDFVRCSKFRTPTSLSPPIDPAMLQATSPGSGRRRGASGEALQSAKRTRDPEDSGSDSDGDSGSDSDGDFVRCSKFRIPISLSPAIDPAMLQATSPGSGRRRGASGEALQSAKRTRDPEDSGSDSDGDSGSDSDGDFVSDLREIVCLLRLIKGGANKDGQKMCEQIIASVAEDIQAMLEDTKLKFEMERQNLLKVLSNTSKQCESSLNEEYTKFQETYEMFCKEKDAHVQTFRDLFSKLEVEKKKLLEQYEHHKMEETATLSELDNTFSEKITNAEQSLRRMKQDDKSFIVFRKSIGSFLECGSDDDFDLDDE